MRILHKVVLSFGAIALLSATVTLTGCTQQNSSGFGPDIPAQAKAESAGLIVGEPENADKSIVITNHTGLTVTAVSLKLTSEEGFGAPFLSQVWSDGQKLTIYMTNRQQAVPGAPVLFDIQAKLDSGVLVNIDGVDLLNIKAADLRIDFESGIAYLEYRNDLGLQVSTLGQTLADIEAQNEIRRQLEAAEQERLAAEAAAAAEAEAAAAAEDEYVDYGYGGGYDGGGGSGGSVTQSDDACVDDLILR